VKVLFFIFGLSAENNSRYINDIFIPIVRAHNDGLIDRVSNFICQLYL